MATLLTAGEGFDEIGSGVAQNDYALYITSIIERHMSDSPYPPTRRAGVVRSPDVSGYAARMSAMRSSDVTSRRRFV